MVNARMSLAVPNIWQVGKDETEAVSSLTIDAFNRVLPAPITSWGDACPELHHADFTGSETAPDGGNFLYFFKRKRKKNNEQKA